MATATRPGRLARAQAATGVRSKATTKAAATSRNRKSHSQRGLALAVPRGTARATREPGEVPAAHQARHAEMMVPGCQAKGSATATTPPRRPGARGRRSGRRCGSRTGRPATITAEEGRAGEVQAITISRAGPRPGRGAAAKPGHPGPGSPARHRAGPATPGPSGRRPARHHLRGVGAGHGGEPDGHQPETGRRQST